MKNPDKEDNKVTLPSAPIQAAQSEVIARELNTEYILLNPECLVLICPATTCKPFIKKNKFDVHENKLVSKIHFHLNGFAQILVLNLNLC